MKACEMRGDVSPFRGKSIGKGGAEAIKAFNYVTRKQEEKEIAGQLACPFSLEPCGETTAAEKKKQRQRICPFTLESLNVPSMSYCRAGR